MIKISLSDTVKREVEDNHWEYFEAKCLQKFRDKARNEKDALRKDIFSYLLDDANENYRLKYHVILGTGENLRNVVASVEAKIKNHLSYGFKEWEYKLKPTKSLIPLFSKFSRPKLSEHINDLKKAGTYISEIQNIFDSAGEINTVSKAMEIGREIKAKYKDLCSLHKIKKPIYKNIKSTLKDELEEIIDYDTFSESYNGWGAYSLTKSLNVNTCPYCNRAYSHTHVSENGRTRAPLDHFMPKSDYPYLALSLYNLVPSCQVCNSSFKGGKDLFMMDHIYPYEEHFGMDARFDIDLCADKDGKYSIPLVSGVNAKENFNVILKINSSSSIKAKIENSNDTFHIEEIYQYHKDYVLEILRKLVYYNQTKIDELLNDNVFVGLFESRAELIQTLFGNYLEEQHLSKRVLSKLTKDIWEEYGLRDMWKL